MLARVLYSSIPVFRLAVEEILEKLKGFSFDFAVVAFDPNRYVIDESVVLTLDDLVGKERWLAFHSVASFANHETVEGGVVALFMKFQRKGKLKLRSFKRLSERYGEIKNDLRRYLHLHRKDLNIIISTLSRGLPGFLVEELSFEGKVPTLVGGVASGIPEKGIDYIYTSEGIIDDGFAVISFKNVAFSYGIAFGYEFLGPIYRITDADKNAVLEVDNEPIELLKSKLLKGLEEDAPEILWYIPWVILDETTESINVLRTPKDFVNQGGKVALEFYGPIREGWRFRFAFADKHRLLETDTKEAIVVKKRMPPGVDLVFNFSCVVRQFLLEDLYKKEAETYASVFNAPLFGFFTWGEIGPNRKGTELKYYNQTSLIVALREY